MTTPHLAGPPLAPPSHAVPPRHRRQRGQGMVEYAFILMLVAIVILIALQVLGGTTNHLYSNISNGLGAASNP